LAASQPAAAQTSNTSNVPPPPGYPASGAARQPVSRQSAATIQAPANYTYPPPPGYTYPPPPGYGTSTKAAPTKTTSNSAKKSTTAPKTSTPKAAAPKYYGPTGDISSQVSKLVESDKVQNARLGELERDVSGMKRGSKGSSGPRYDGGTDLAAHTTYVVRPGDTMWSVATKHRISVGEIQQLNRLTSEAVTVGQTLLIASPHRNSSTTPASYQPATPGGSAPVKSSSTSYTVKKGDSLKAIAIRHKMTTAELASANRIKDANKIIVGQRLTIPGKKGTQVAATTPKVEPASSDTIPLPNFGLPSSPPPAAIAPSAPVYPTTPAATPKPTPSAADSHRGILAYRVDRSDTIDSIAQQFTTTPERIREMNRLDSSTPLKPGDEIMVPAMGAVSVRN
jgi:LysM repeat protein